MNEQQSKVCHIETGPFVGSAWGSNPRWTPYARAIAAHYPAQPPLFWPIEVVLAAPPPSLTLARLFYTRPQKYDSLIFGFSATQAPAPESSGNLYVQIAHNESAIPWVVDNQIGFAPLGAFAGINRNVMSVQQLPEAFFLPAHTTLKFSFLPFSMDTDPTVTVRLTMLGVQLINNTPGFQAPKTVKMPNGDEIPVGSRLPWFATIPYGARNSPSINRPFGDFILGPRAQAVQYAPANDCTVEIHGTYASFLDSPLEFNDTATLLKVKTALTRRRNSWTPMFTPVQAVMGSIAQVNVSSPFPVPILLKPGQRIQLTEQNDNSGVNTDVTRGTVTFRGVRLCEY